MSLYTEFTTNSTAVTRFPSGELLRPLPPTIIYNLLGYGVSRLVLGNLCVNSVTR